MPSEPQPVIWARLSGQGRGPTRTLDYEKITRVAVLIADEEGLEAVSMRKIATRMDHSTMSLYRHIGSKDDLIELMYDAVLGELDLDAGPTDSTDATGSTGDWRSHMTDLVRDVRQLYHRHPWVSRLGQRPTLGPNGIRLLEYALARVDTLGLGIDAMLDLVQTAIQFTQGFVQAELGEVEAQRRTGLDQQAYHQQTAPYIARLLEDDKHPYLRRLIVEAEDFPNPDVVFERRLAMVLNGVADGLGRLTR